ncbi:MAG: S8 family serine peptidase [Planctomycetes bacterium]|nr:S8 family serine peptidase [Planctomycetota bacterium]
MISNILISAVLSAQSPALPQDDILQYVDLGFDRAVFRIDDLDNLQSDALRLNDDHISKQGVIPEPSSGYVLYSRVIVEAESANQVESFANYIGESWVTNLEGSPGFFLVHTNSVRDALDMANGLDAYLGDENVYIDALRPLSTRALPSDPSFGSQWHLVNVIAPTYDVNIEGAWNAGYTGTGQCVGIIDGGVQTNHPDLQANRNATASSTSSSSSHGTSCAGVSSAVANNGRGGVGAAYDSQWAGLLYGSSSTTSNAFGYRNDINTIKSNSWGPYDDGTISYMSSAERNALTTAVTSGRGGLGEVFTWAAGNGGSNDRVEYDPYASSRYTIAVGAIGDGDTRSWYNEQGSSMLVVAQSDGNNRGIYTTTNGSSYTSSFGGTSSACPLGAGVAALILDANPALTWRDVQAVMIESTRINNSSNSNWTTSAAGYDINVNYGYGALDATAATALASTWVNLPPEQNATSGQVSVNTTIPDNDTVGLTRTATISSSFIVESVEVKLNASHGDVGDLYIKLTSPSGQNSVLAKDRNDTTNNYSNFIFTSNRHFGEDALGDWSLEISDRRSGTTGTWSNFTVTVYGHDAGGASMSLSTNGLVGGASSTLDVDNGAANTKTYLAYSLAGTGSYSVPALGITLGITAPSLATSPQFTNAAGALTYMLSIPGSASGRSVWMQACQAGQVSNVLALTVQ